jgi:antitoxin MazE
MMISKVKKWGNSQGLRLSKQLLDLADIAIGDDVQIIAGEHQILIKKATSRKYDLKELVKRIPKSYKPKEVNFGRAVGREEW